MLEYLESRRVPLKQIKVNPKKNQEIQNLILSLNSQNPDLKYLAQKAFVSYVKSYHLNGSKEIFISSELPLKEYAESMGLIGMPRIRFIQKLRPDKNIPDAVLKAKEALQERKLKKQSKTDDNQSDSDSSDYESDDEVQQQKLNVKTKAEKLRTRVNQGTLSEHYKKLVEDDESEEEDLLVPKRVDHELEENLSKPKQMSNRQKRKLLSENVHAINSKIVFDEEGNAMDELEAVSKNLPEANNFTREEYISSIRDELKSADREDYLRSKQLRKEKLAKKKERARQEALGISGDVGVSIATLDDNFEDFGSESEEDNDQQSESDSVSDGSDSENADSDIDNTSMLEKRKKRPSYDSDDDTESTKKSKKQKIDFEDVEDIEERALRILESKGL